MNKDTFLMNTTKEKILEVAYKKMCEGFGTDFLPRNKFEERLSQEKLSIIKKLKSLKGKYDELLNNEETRYELLKINKEDFILNEFNNISRWRRYKLDELEYLKESESKNYKKFEKLFNINFSKKENIFISDNNYIHSRISQIKSNGENNIQNLFWNFCLSYRYFNYDFSKDDVYDVIIEKFHDDYVSNENFELYELIEKNLDDIEFSGFETFVVNIGTRNNNGSRSGWTTNSFKVINENKEYSFETSTKDEKGINGKFINIFILQFQKRRLLKLSINLTETDYTPYIIYKDFEKISLKNNCEILITKHHGNEYLIFDTKKQALDFQEKVMEIKAGNNKFQR